MPVRVRELEQPLGGERFHRLADDRPAGAELAAQLRLVGEGRVRPEIATHDPAAELFEHVREEAALAGETAAATGGVEIRHARTIAQLNAA